MDMSLEKNTFNDENERDDYYDATKVVQSKKLKFFETAGLNKIDKLQRVPGIGKGFIKKLQLTTITTKVYDLLFSTTGLMLVFLQLQDPGESFELVQEEFYRFLRRRLDISERPRIHQIVSAISGKVKQYHLWKTLSMGNVIKWGIEEEEEEEEEEIGE